MNIHGMRFTHISFYLPQYNTSVVPADAKIEGKGNTGLMENILPVVSCYNHFRARNVVNLMIEYFIGILKIQPAKSISTKLMRTILRCRLTIG